MRKDCKVCGSVSRSAAHRMKCLKGSKFIRIVKKSCARRLTLPVSFARKAGEFLEQGAILYGEDGQTWRVQVMRHNGGCTFGKGWPVFYEMYKVGKGTVLLFKYLGYSGFKVDMFDGCTGVAPVSGSGDGHRSDGNGLVGTADGTGAAAGVNAASRMVGRPRIAYQISADIRDVELYGMNLRLFASYNLRGELRCRGLPVHGCKGQLVERLGRYILECGEEVDEPEVKIEPALPWDM